MLGAQHWAPAPLHNPHPSALEAPPCPLPHHPLSSNGPRLPTCSLATGFQQLFLLPRKLFPPPPSPFCCSAPIHHSEMSVPRHPLPNPCPELRETLHEARVPPGLAAGFPSESLNGDPERMLSAVQRLTARNGPPGREDRPGQGKAGCPGPQPGQFKAIGGDPRAYPHAPLCPYFGLPLSENKMPKYIT